jgi:quinoprotein glucose dehydrogenase
MMPEYDSSGRTVWFRNRRLGVRRQGLNLRRVLACSFLNVLLASAVFAQSAPVTIRAGTLLDGRGGVRRDVIVTLEDGRIQSIIPAPATTTADYDLSAYTLMPGGIDTHVHINWHFDPDGRTHHLAAREEPVDVALRYAEENAAVTLRSGITTVQSLGASVDGALRDAIAAGNVVGPRVITSLRSISERTGTPDEIRVAVRSLHSDGADVIKIFASASIRDGGPPTMSQEQLDAACGEARALGLRSAVHAHGPESARRAILAGCTVIEHGALLDEATLDLMADRGMFYDPNIGLVLQNYLDNRSRFLGVGNYTEEGFAHMERAVPLALDVFRKALLRPGIRIVFGTDAVAGAHGRNFEELIYRVQVGGQSAMAAVVSATSLAAASLGMADSVGSLANGYVADLIALNGNPADDITALRKVRFVMKGGKVIRDETRASDWTAWGADAASTKFSSLAHIDRTNVNRLELAWEWRAGEDVIEATDSTPAARPGNFQATPLAIGDTLFLSTPFNRVVALDARNGREIWRHDPGAWRAGQPSNGTGFVHRGVATWSDGNERRIFMNSRWRLIALDARTGTPIESFGENGEVDLADDLIWDINRLHYTNTSPPLVVGDLVIVGNGVGDRLTYRNDPPGDVQAFDVRTGERVWRFNPIPRPGEFGNETWEDRSWEYTGHTNVWAPMSADLERGLVYLPVSTPSNDFYGGARKGDNLFAESLVCLDARTGQRVWHYQIVHHGVWDYDLPTAPVLGTARVNGALRDVVVQLTKQGFAFVFDRVSGEPIWPIEERPVPASDVPGERVSPTQPVPSRPAPFAGQGFTAEDLVDFTPDLRRFAEKVLEQYRTGPLYTPPSLEGTVMMPGVIGGAGWGGGAFDPESGILYVKASNNPALIRLIDLPPTDTIDAAYSFDRSATTLSFRGATPPPGVSFTAPPDGIPFNRPPYGTLTAIDLNSGEHRWQVPIGDTPGVREHPLLRDLGLPPLGVAGAPGPMVTAGGLLFVTGGGQDLVALDKASGLILWQTDLGAAGYANPMTYATSDNRQFVVTAVGAGSSAVLKAYAIPR